MASVVSAELKADNCKEGVKEKLVHLREIRYAGDGNTDTINYERNNSASIDC